MTADVENQLAAWDRYAAARHRADETLRFEDGKAAVLAWKEFANCYLDDDRKFALENGQANVIRFPVRRAVVGRHD